MATDKSTKQRLRAKAAQDFVTLPKKYDPNRHFPGAAGRGKIDISGWYVFTKIDGVRARLKDGKLWTRSQKELVVPQEFIDSITDFYGDLELDGELIHSSSNFNKTVSIVRNQKTSQMESMWDEITYYVFDYVDSVPYSERIKKLQQIENKIPSVNSWCLIDQVEISSPCPVTILGPLGIVNDPETVRQFMKVAIQNKWEGLILRNPEMEYTLGRTSDLLKVKEFQDCEVTVIKTERGEGRLANMLGALICKMDNGNVVKVGTGFTDIERSNPPKVGDRITISYFELTDDGIPRFPVYVCIRDYE